MDARHGRARAAEEPVKRMERFVDHYLANGGNGSKAALAAGYAKDSARVTASRLLAKANVRAMIQAKAAPAVERLQLSRERVIHEVAKLTHAEVESAKFYDEHGALKLPKEWTPEMSAAVCEIEMGEDGRPKKIKLRNKDRVLELAARITGVDTSVKAQFASLHIHIHD